MEEVGGIFIYKYLTDIFFQAMFIDITSSNQTESGYSIFSYDHLIDIINQSLLLSPLLLVYIVFFKAKALFTNDKIETLFLAISSIGGLIFLLFVDPKLGMARDWDLFALTLYPVTLFVILKNKTALLNKIIF